MPTTFEIHPAIGVARLGTSSEHFIGPEPDFPLDLLRRDSNGKLLRQAARFRVFQCERDTTDKLLDAIEITTANARIEWSVHVVNRKGAAPRFLGDGRRNNAKGDDNLDRDLIIDSGEQSLSEPGNVLLDQGRFMGKSVPLGQISMEPSGRLLVLGGFGNSASIGSHPIDNFADNDEWHDDVSDGPVRARVRFASGQVVDAVPAWIIVTPPDFAPEITNLVTLYDVLQDLGVSRGILSAPTRISFEKHVRPILERAMGYQWVNGQAREGFSSAAPFHGPGPGGHGPGGPGVFDLTALSDPALATTIRTRIFRLLRNPDGPSTPAIPPLKRMPRLNDENDSGDVFALTKLQYRAMQLWASGQFLPTDPSDTQTELLPDALTRIALEACAGGPFFPGIEAGRILREPGRYFANEPFRLSPAALKPGEVTQGNALPWQADYHLCRWEESDGGASKKLGWWPAQRPDDVLRTPSGTPISWARGLADQFESMVSNWHRLGFVKQDSSNPGVFIEQDRDPSLSETESI
jgi:L-Lysine epsilon oxidase N-terminal/L-lysine epsilon oxidase C-terminal domain